jgi:hypothetical protein
MDSEGFNNGTALLKNNIAIAKNGVFTLNELVIQLVPRTV